MADTILTLAQSNPLAATLTDAYTVPASTSTTISSLTVVNRSSTATSFRISVAKAGAADSNEQYIYYDLPIAGNDTFIATIGITLATTDVVRVFSALATCSFNIFGLQIT